jgi:hypothetical protein
LTFEVDEAMAMTTAKQTTKNTAESQLTAGE